MRRLLADETVAAAEELEGLRLAAWVSDEGTERFGGIELWDSAQAADREPPGRLVDLIGKDPDIVERFDLEATAEGRSAMGELGRRGLALE